MATGELTDADVFGPAAGVPGQVWAEAQRQGVDPGLALRVAHQESGFNQSAVSPKGARGVMQLMPATAATLGVNPDDIADNIRGGVAYLKRQVDTFGDPSLAAAAYNAGPEAVRQAGGVPNIPETHAYVANVAPQRELSDAEVFGQRAPAPKAAPPAAMPPAAPQGVQPVSPRPAIQPNPTIAQDVWSGFSQPFVNLGHDMMDQYRATTARAKQPLPNPIDAAKATLADIGQTGKIVGDVVGLIPSALQNAAVRPTARGVTRTGLQPWRAPQLTFVNGKPVLAPARPLSGDEAQAAIENSINMALSGARPASPVPIAAAAPKPMDLDAMRAAKNAAYQAVDASGFKFPQTDVQNLASTISQAVAQKGGPQAARLYPDSTAMAARLDALAKQPGGVPLTQLDTLRSDIYDALVAPGGKESSLGKMMRSQIDGLINSSGAPDIAAARDLNTRYAKMKALSDAAETAADKLPANGNITQPMRTQAQQLVGPKSSQRIQNLTPDETAALKKLARGTSNQGLPTTIGRVFDPRSLLGTTVNTMVGLMTGGHGPVVTAPLGMLSTAASSRGTQKGIQQLMDLFSTGGAKPAPVYPTLALGGRPAIPLTSTRGLIGASALAQLPDWLRSLAEPKTPTPTTAQPAR